MKKESSLFVVFFFLNIFKKNACRNIIKNRRMKKKVIETENTPSEKGNGCL